MSGIGLSRRRVAKNTLSQMVAVGLSVGTKALAAIAIARIHGPEGLGAYALAWSLAGTVGFACLLGLDSRLIREMSRTGSCDETARTMPLATVLSFTAAALIAIVPSALGAAPQVASALAASSVFIALTGPVLVYRAAFHASERMEFEVAAIAAEGAAGLGLVVIALVTGGGVARTILALGAARVVNLVVSGRLFRRVCARAERSAVRPHISWPRLLRASIPFGIMYALTGVALRVDMIVLTALRSPAEAGIYGAASVAIMTTAVVAGAFTGSLYPVLSRAEDRRDPELVRLFAATWHVLLGAGVVIALVVTLLARPAVAIAYGPGFEQTATVLAVLAWAIPFRFVNSLGGFTLAATAPSAKRLLGVGSLFLVHVAMTLAGVVLFGVAGAVAAILLTEVIIAAVLLTSLHPLRPTFPTPRRQVPPPGSVRRSFNLGGLTSFVVGDGDDRLTAAVHRRFGHLAAEGPAEVRVDVVPHIARPAGTWRAGRSDEGVFVITDRRGRACELPIERATEQSLRFRVEAGFCESAFVYRVLFPILRTRLAAGGRATIVHASAVRIDGRGVLLAGAEATGKTAAMIRLLRQGAELISNDWTLIESSGRLHPLNMQVSVRDRDRESGIVLPLRTGPEGRPAVGWAQAAEAEAPMSIEARGPVVDLRSARHRAGDSAQPRGRRPVRFAAGGPDPVLFRGCLADIFPECTPVSGQLDVVVLRGLRILDPTVEDAVACLAAGLREQSRESTRDATALALTGDGTRFTDDLAEMEEAVIIRALRGTAILAGDEEHLLLAPAQVPVAPHAATIPTWREEKA